MLLEVFPSHGVMFCIGHGMIPGAGRVALCPPMASPILPLMIIPDDASGAELGFTAAVGFVTAAESEL